MPYLLPHTLSTDSIPIEYRTDRSSSTCRHQGPLGCTVLRSSTFKVYIYIYVPIHILPLGCGHSAHSLLDRLYLASYHSPPSENTPFPFLAAPPKSPSKRRAGASTPSRKHQAKAPVYFNIDGLLLYNSFHADFGPFHIGHLYRFAVHFHEILGDPENADRPVVLWTKPDSRSRANVACVVACYMVLIQSWPPHLALAPIAQADPPYMPFRDAGYSQADFVLTIQDVVYGVWKAKEEGLCGLKDFSLEE